MATDQACRARPTRPAGQHTTVAATARKRHTPGLTKWAIQDSALTIRLAADVIVATARRRGQIRREAGGRAPADLVSRLHTTTVETAAKNGNRPLAAVPERGTV